MALQRERRQNPQLILDDIKPVGYHAWVDADRLALFVLGQPTTLQLAQREDREGRGRRQRHRPIAAPHSGHAPGQLRAPGAVEEFWIKQIDIDSKKIDPLTKVVEGNTERDMTWMPDGKTILMSGGTKVYSWTRGAPGWTEVFDAAPHNLGAVSRLAVSPKGDAIAIVVAEPQEIGCRVRLSPRQRRDQHGDREDRRCRRSVPAA